MLFRCSAMFPSISASTAVLHNESIGISPFFRCFYCRLNSLVMRKANVFVGTASKCWYGVFIVLWSSLIVNLPCNNFILVHWMDWFGVLNKGCFFEELLHVLGPLDSIAKLIADDGLGEYFRHHFWWYSLLYFLILILIICGQLR